MAKTAAKTGDRRQGPERTRTKTCPRCGARLFEDMSVCYECLYDFDRVPQPLGLPTLDELDGLLPGDEPAGDAEEAGNAGVRTEEQPCDELAPDDAWKEEAQETGGHPAEEEGLAWAGPWEDLPPFEGEPGEKGLEEAESQRDADVRRRWPAGASADDTLVAGACDRGQPPMLLVCGSEASAWVPLAREGICVGRADDNDVVLTAPTVSRRHLRILPQGDKAVVEDLGSKNHALLDGKLLVGARAVGAGARIELGDVELVIARRPPKR